MPARTLIAVRRSDGREFRSFNAAMRSLAGTDSEIAGSEMQRMRLALRRGRRTVHDRYGFSWTAISLPANATQTQVAQAVAAVFAEMSWDSLTFGIELETISPLSHQDAWASANAIVALLEVENFGRWQAKHDGSLNGGTGVEFVSPILKGEDGLAAVRRACDLIKGAGFAVNKSCGMHVHIGARDFDNGQLCNIAAAFVANEGHFDSLVAQSRRANNNRYCQTVAHRSIPMNSRSVESIATAINGGFERGHYTSYRYHKLNFQSYAFHGTIEFRQHQGTVESDKACAWVRLIAGFVATTQRQRTGVMTFAEFAAMSGPFAGYLEMRRQKFAQIRAAA